MYCTRNVSDSVVWVGASDRRLALFENLFPIPRGVSYNSYLILDEKTALLDTTDAYGISGVTVDTHVFRISHRLGWANGKNPVETEEELMRVLPKDHWNRINFQLIYHGRSICTARKAKCSECGLQAWCEKRVEKKQA